MDFLAILDYEHLDNGVFLSSFAKSLSRKKKRGIIIHGDSQHTERIIQTGVMRKDAEIRAIKELNHRLVALFADEGISTIALNGFQKSLLTIDNDTVQFDKKQIDALPDQPMILLSNLALDLKVKSYRPLPLSDMAVVVAENFGIDAITVFNKDKSSDFIKQDFPETLRIEKIDASLVKKHIPKHLRGISMPIRIKSASTF
ncbi:hypothetical protein [Rhodohalobacter sp. 614A]|uniref:hypothetical protein n=1 Tax=Rhodohalobacter sp. 614A TaxID=2908649 RepID=UPI001F1A4773|nr:hypothetical protein [Rhodohalobacter sp. 614A]